MRWWLDCGMTELTMALRDDTFSSTIIIASTILSTIIIIIILQENFMLHLTIMVKMTMMMTIMKMMITPKTRNALMTQLTWQSGGGAAKVNHLGLACHTILMVMVMAVML